MQICKRTLLIETGLVAAIALAISAALWPESLGLAEVGFHPVWVAVIAMAARYGVPGLLVAIPVMWLPIGGVAYLETGGQWLLVERAQNGVDLAPLSTAVIVAWITISHQNRRTRLAEIVDDAEREADDTRRWGEALEDSLIYLRDRCDRIEVSVSFWRRIAECIERGSTRQAAGAGLELAMNRTDADTGCVMLGSESPELLAGSASWAGPDLSADTVAARAVASGELQCAHQLPGAQPSDCDVVIPVLDPDDCAVVGVIALRGVGPTALKAAELSDLKLIAAWLAPSLATRLRGTHLRTVAEGSA